MSANKIETKDAIFDVKSIGKHKTTGIIFNNVLWCFNRPADIPQSGTRVGFGCAEFNLSTFKSQFYFSTGVSNNDDHWGVASRMRREGAIVYQCETKEQFFQFFGLILENQYALQLHGTKAVSSTDLVGKSQGSFGTEYRAGYGRLGFLGWSPSEHRTFQQNGIDLDELVDFLNNKFVGVANHFRITSNKFNNSNHVEWDAKGPNQNVIWTVVVVHGDRDGKKMYNPTAHVALKEVTMIPDPSFLKALKEETKKVADAALKTVKKVAVKKAAVKKVVAKKAAPKRAV